MEKTNYGKHTEQYDQWYDNNPSVYSSELEAIRELITEVTGRSIEIGAGTGRFSSELDITYGIDPEERMLQIAKSRGTYCIKGIAEGLPFKGSSMELAMIVTSFCLMDGDRALEEIHRILTPGGILLIAFVERNSPLGEKYRKKAAKSRFFRDVELRTTDEILAMLKAHGFEDMDFRQTLFKPLNMITSPEKAEKGFDRGSFIVIRARCIKSQ